MNEVHHPQKMFLPNEPKSKNKELLANKYSIDTTKSSYHHDNYKYYALCNDEVKMILKPIFDSIGNFMGDKENEYRENLKYFGDQPLDRLYFSLPNSALMLELKISDNLTDDNVIIPEFSFRVFINTDVNEEYNGFLESPVIGPSQKLVISGDEFDDIDVKTVASSICGMIRTMKEHEKKYNNLVQEIQNLKY